MAPGNVSATTAPAWQARLARRRIYARHVEETEDGETKVVTRPVNLFFVVLERGDGEEIIFPVSWPLPYGRLVFTDRRERSTGTAGSMGLWGTRPPSKPGGKGHTLTPTAWKEEVRRFIGSEEADKIVRLLIVGKPRNDA
jgi:hypothetical protein